MIENNPRSFGKSPLFAKTFWSCVAFLMLWNVLSHGQGASPVSAHTWKKSTNGDTLKFIDGIDTLKFLHTGGGNWTFRAPNTITLTGGTTVTSSLAFKTTSGVGVTGADIHFLVGNNGGTEAMHILNNGRVGIGTVAPNAPLDVTGSSAGNVGGFPSGALHITNPSSSVNQNAVITGHNSFNGNTQLWYGGSVSSANNHIAFINRQDADLFLSTNNTERLRITNTGNVGIGTGAPDGLLHVLSTDLGGVAVSAQANDIIIEGNGVQGITIFSGSSSAGNIFFADAEAAATGRIQFDHSDNSLRFYTGGVEEMRISSGGNVGIGDNSPAALLTVGDGDDFQVSSVGNVSTTGTVDWGSAVSLMLPSVAAPLTDVGGKIAFDKNDSALEINDGVRSVLIPLHIAKSFHVLNPDLVTDTIPLWTADSATMPGGFTITHASIITSVDGAYTFELFEFTSADPPVRVGAGAIGGLIVAAADQRADTATFTDATIAVGNELYYLTPSTNIDWIKVEIRYFIKDND